MRARLHRLAAWLAASAFIGACAPTSGPASAPAQAASQPRCLTPASGPVALDRQGVVELLAGVELEEGDLKAKADSALVRATAAEAYAAQVKREAIVAGTAAAALAAVVAAVATFLAVHK